MHAAMGHLVLLIRIVTLQFWRGLSCALPLLCASFAVCTSSLRHWMFMALCGFGARLFLIVLSVATAAGSFSLSVCVGFFIVAVSCGLWPAPFPIGSLRALSVHILSTSAFSCRLEGLSMIAPNCSRFSIIKAYVHPPIGIPMKSTTCKHTPCLMILSSFRRFTTSFKACSYEQMVPGKLCTTNSSYMRM